MNLTDLSNEELLSELHALVGHGREVLADVLVMLGEIDHRDLYAELGCHSMHEFCTGHLLMSTGEACRRIAVARKTREYPLLLEKIKSGALNLTTVGLVEAHLTLENYEEVLEEASWKTKRQVQEVVARRFPRPDVPERVTETSSVSPLPAVVEPVSEGRYKVQFTASEELRDKIERARDVMRTTSPDGDLAAVMERAIDLLVEKLEKRTRRNV